jgi:esterase/lipase superfamily enzyme
MTTTSMMITNRNVDGKQLGNQRDKLRFYTSGKTTLRSLDDWTELQGEGFRDALVQIAGEFPVVDESQNEQQKHVSLFVHGYNNSWTEAVQRYRQIQNDLYANQKGLGQLILFTWPSNGSTFDYLPDREDARASGPDLAQVFVDLYDHLVKVQRATAINGKTLPCRAKISVIAHSMGNYVLQKALAVASKMLNSPQLITLIHQSALVAADVDNDLFQQSQPQDSDGSLMANLCYRIGALYTGRDDVLGASAGLKHFGKRRLGRSGLADVTTVYDNVFHIDVTGLLPRNASNIHSAVFNNAATLKLLRLILIGRDRRLLVPGPGT